MRWDPNVYNRYADERGRPNLYIYDPHFAPDETEPKGCLVGPEAAAA